MSILDPLSNCAKQIVLLCNTVLFSRIQAMIQNPDFVKRVMTETSAETNLEAIMAINEVSRFCDKYNAESFAMLQMPLKVTDNRKTMEMTLSFAMAHYWVQPKTSPLEWCADHDELQAEVIRHLCECARKRNCKITAE